MNNNFPEFQEEIFHDALDTDEKECVESLVAQHRDNAALTQQLALDASRIVTASQERLEKQVNSGFCKRLLSAISGKTAQNNLSTQVNMLQMQKVAWHYLQQLQQQNLIKAQSIAVIRNNLGTMNEYIIETRDFLDLAIDKIDGRLQSVENKTRFGNWSLNIEANLRSFKQLPRSLLIVQLTYDFLSSHNDISMTSQDMDHLVVTMERLGINCDDKVRLLDFIIELIEQMDITRIDRYRNHIALSTDAQTIDSEFIQANISGLGFNALYYLSDNYEKITSLINDDQLCNNDEARKKIISRFFGDEFEGLATTYTLRDLLSEIIGASLVTISLFRAKNGLDEQSEQVSETPIEDDVSLVSKLPDIKVHNYLDARVSSDSRRDYVQSLALCLERNADISLHGKEFISKLAVKSGCSDVIEDFVAIAHDPKTKQEKMLRLETLFSNQDHMYSWLLDAFFLLTVENSKIESTQIKRILDILKPPMLKDHLTNIKIVLHESNEEKLFNACINLNQVTQGWSNIIHYRELSFEQFFADEISHFNTPTNREVMQFHLDFLKLSKKAHDYDNFIEPFDDNKFLSKVVGSVSSAGVLAGRKSAVYSLNKMQTRLKEFIESHRAALDRANKLIAQLGIPTFNFKDETGYSDFDLDNSITNDDWGNQFDHYLNCLENTLQAFSLARNDAAAQLQLFANGEFSQSIVERRELEQSFVQKQKQEEALSKRSVPIMREGKRQLFSIEWRDHEGPPCDPEFIRSIKTDEKIWLIGTDHGEYYLSDDRINWQQIYPFGSENTVAREILIINGVWILTSYSEGFRYSYDAFNWQQIQSPDINDDYLVSQTDDIIYLDGTWIWRFTRYREYHYTEKGLIFKSDKTANYNESLFLCTDDLDSEWSSWDEQPSLAEGIEIDSIRSIPGVNSLLIFCSYDWHYIHVKKKINTGKFVKYFIAGKGWRNCTWNNEQEHNKYPVVTRLDERLLCFGHNQVMTSDKGYEWNASEAAITVTECFHLDDISIFSTWPGQTFLISQDGQSFEEITLDDGKWEFPCFNNSGALSLYSPNSHETLLRIGNYVFHDAHLK